MSAKLVYSLEDENQNLKKQIGCINSLFHLYDRHRFLSRRVNGSNHKRLPPVAESGNQAVKSSTTHQNATQKDQNKVFKDIRRNSIESTRALVSSSPSSFSPVDYAKSLQVEPCVSSPTISTETASIHELLTNRPNFTIQSSKQCLSLGDVVRDSMHREARGIAVKTTSKDEAVVRTLTYIDSPRPSTPPTSVKPRLSDLSESCQVFAKLPEATRSSNEGRDGCMHWAPKEFRRLSYDGRDTHKSTINLKELPRLSLDSRVGSLRDSNSVIKGNCDQTIDLRQEPGRSKRSSSIIAKLMGLEALPNSTSTNGCQSRFDNNYQTEENDSLSTLKDMQHSYSGSQKNVKKNLASNQMKNVDLVLVEATSSQKFPLETAPWKQIYGSKGSQSPDSKCHEAPPRAINSSSPSVHGEIEKIISELEFKWSGKDLRALKQILEAMQKTKEMLNSKKDETSSFKSRMSNNSSLYCNTLLESHESIPSDISISPRASDPPKTYKSPIIMKPAKLQRENTDPASAGSFDSLTRTRKLQTSHSTFHEKEPKHPTQKNVQITKCRTGGQSSRDKSTNTNTSKYVQASKTPQNNREGNSCHSDKITGTETYDPKHKQFGSDKQPCQVIPSSDSSKTRMHHNKLNIESSRLARKDTSESPNLQRSKDRLRETKTNMRYLSNQSDSLSIQSEIGISLGSHTFKETNFEHDGKDQRDPAVGLSEAEAGKASGEQPSPVSVLDATFYKDDLTSPVKKKSIAFEDDETLYPDEVKWQIMDLAQQSSRESCVSSEIDIKTLEHIKNLDQNPQQANFSEAKTPIGHPITLQYDSTNPDHRYILYILLASELYGYLDSSLINIRFQKLDHIINPKLFFALEQVKASTKLSHDDNRYENLLLKYDQTIHRKLVFDVVNEILCHKLAAVDSLKQCLVQKPRQQHFVGKLCTEIDRLQGRDLNGNLVHEDDNMRSIIPEDLMDWLGCDSEISGVVLDIERLIFKDLITEVATGMTAVSQCSPINVSSNT